MKKILITVLIILLVFLAYYTIANGVNIGSFKAFGIQEMQEENSNIDTKISQASKLTSTEYPKKMSDLSASTKELLKAKEDYTDLTNYSTESQIEEANQLVDYEIELLWERIGTSATEEGLDIDIKGTNSSIPTTADGRKLYDLNFTVVGSYVGTALFISELENNSDLEFKIENFKMVQGTNGLQSTFVVRNIPIKSSNIATSSSTNIQENTTNTTNTTNNATNTNTTNNTANATNNTINH